MSEKITVRQSAQSIIVALRYLLAEAFLKLCRLCGLIPTPPPPLRDLIEKVDPEDTPIFSVSKEECENLADILDGISSVMPFSRANFVSSTYCGETSFCGHSPCPDEHCIQGGGHLLRLEKKHGRIHDTPS